MSLPAKNTSPGEIEHIIKQLPIKKSPGHDLISNVITKNLPKKIIIFFITHIQRHLQTILLSKHLEILGRYSNT